MREATKKIEEIKKKIERINTINTTIERLNNIINELSSFGKCESINYGHYGKAS